MSLLTLIEWRIRLMMMMMHQSFLNASTQFLFNLRPSPVNNFFNIFQALLNHTNLYALNARRQAS